MKTSIYNNKDIRKFRDKEGVRKMTVKIVEEELKVLEIDERKEGYIELRVEVILAVEKYPDYIPQTQSERIKNIIQEGIEKCKPSDYEAVFGDMDKQTAIQNFIKELARYIRANCI